MPDISRERCLEMIAAAERKEAAGEETIPSEVLRQLLAVRDSILEALRQQQRHADN